MQYNNDNALTKMLANVAEYRRAGRSEESRQQLTTAFAFVFKRLAAIQLAHDIQEPFAVLVKLMRTVSLIDRTEHDYVLSIDNRKQDDIKTAIERYRSCYLPTIVGRLSPAIETQGKMRLSNLHLNFTDHPALVRDSFRCVYCGVDLLSSFHLFATASLDHFRPKSAGGPDNTENRAAACCSCDRMKASAAFPNLDAARTALDEQRAALHALYEDARRRIKPEHVTKIKPGKGAE